SARTPRTRRVERQRFVSHERREALELRGQRRGRVERASDARVMCGCRRRVLQNETKKNESQIAVDRLRAGYIFERHRADRLLKFPAPGVIAKEGKVRRESRAVREQISNGHAFAVGTP